MRNIETIIRHNLKMFFNSIFSIGLLVMPIFITIALVSMLGGEKVSTDVKIGVVMAEKVIGAETLFEELGEHIHITYLKEEEALEQLEQKKINAMITVHTENLLKDLAAGKNSLEITCYKGDPVADYVTQQLDIALGTVTTLTALSGEEERLEALYKEYKEAIPEVKVDDSDSELARIKVVFGMFIMIFLFTCIKSLQAMMQEKESKVYERICASPIKRYQYILGHISGAFIILMIQVIVQGILMNMIGITFGLGLIQFIGISLVLAVVGISMSLIILSCTRNSQGYFIVGSFIISPLCMISDCIFPKEFLPEAVNKVALLSPIRWIMTVYSDIIVGGSVEKIITSVLIALGISTVLVLMGMVIENSKRVI